MVVVDGQDGGQAQDVIEQPLGQKRWMDSRTFWHRARLGGGGELETNMTS